MSFEFERFSANLKESKRALEFVENRNLSSKLIDNHLLGYCFPKSYIRFPLLKGRILVPIHNAHNELIALAGRQCPGSEPAVLKELYSLYSDTPSKAQEKISKWQKSKWINEPYPKSKHLFNLNLAKDFAREKKYLIIVEGYFDVYMLCQNNINNVVALSGLSLSDLQIALILRYCDSVVLLLDSDDAGQNAALRIKEQLNEQDIFCSNIVLPEGYDPDSFVQNHSAERLFEIIEYAVKNKKTKIKIT